MRMYLLTIQFVLITILLILEGVRSLRWLGINNSLVDESDEQDVRRYLCSSSATAAKNRLLDKDQKRICRKKIKMMKYVVTAAELAKTECLRLTKYERWNCRGILLAPKFSRDLRVGTRESAFLHALSSAALVFAVTQGCAADERCDCGRIPSRSLLKRHERKHPGKKYQYGGCHDNIAVGIRFSKDFLDRRELRQTKPADRKLVNLHNNDVGRKVVTNSLNLTCRLPSFVIPGAGGREDCLYRLIVSFSKIAEDIFNRYKQARIVNAVRSKNSKKGTILKYTSNGVGNSKKLRKAHPADMVYLYRSPDFCLPDINDPIKNPGTKGRMCAKRIRSIIKNLHQYNPTIPVRFDVCATLCCGRGHTTKPNIVEVICTCRFSYSKMSLKCSKCPVVAEISVCN